MSNRHQRRAMRAKAKQAAAQCAAACYDYTASGSMVRVTNPRAISVLERAFEMMLRTGQPVTLQISEGEASAFPRWAEGHAGMVHYIGAWIDPSGRCSYTIRSAAVRHAVSGELHPGLSAEAADAQAHEALAEITRYSGFPAIRQTGGRA